MQILSAVCLAHLPALVDRCGCDWDRFHHLTHFAPVVSDNVLREGDHLVRHVVKMELQFESTLGAAFDHGIRKAFVDDVERPVRAFGDGTGRGEDLIADRAKRHGFTLGKTFLPRPLHILRVLVIPRRRVQHTPIRRIGGRRISVVHDVRARSVNAIVPHPVYPLMRRDFTQSLLCAVE